MSVSWKAMFFFVIIGWIALAYFLWERQTGLRWGQYPPAATSIASFSSGTIMPSCTIWELALSSSLERPPSWCLTRFAQDGRLTTAASSAN